MPLTTLVLSSMFGTTRLNSNTSALTIEDSRDSQEINIVRLEI
jgi:hypothetical protein